MGVRSGTSSQLTAEWRTAVGQPLLALAYLTHSLQLREASEMPEEGQDDVDEEIAQDELIRVRFAARFLDPEAQICMPREAGVASWIQGRTSLPDQVEDNAAGSKEAIEAVCRKSEVAGPARGWWEALVLGGGRSRCSFSFACTVLRQP